jgi:hypothetical protein
MSSVQTVHSAVRWANATIVWTPEQFILRIPVMIEERAAEYAGPELSTKLPNVDVTIRHGQIIRDERGTKAVEGSIELGTPLLFQLNAHNVKALVDNTVEAAVAAGDRDQARDEALAAEFLTALRQSG